MSEARPFRLTTALLLAAPIIGVIATLVAGGLTRVFGPGPADAPSGPRTTVPAPPRAPDAARPDLPELPDLGRAGGDFPPDRFWERVDGAAESLIKAGCTRLLFWRTTDPAAETEVLLFGSAAGAAGILSRDAGEDRTPGPGDEASVSGQAVFFRRGNAYVRIVGDSQAPPDPARLLDLAWKVDTGIRVLTGAAGHERRGIQDK